MASRRPRFDAERRLRPVYDAYDTQNYKLALKLTGQLESKYGEQQELLSFKCLCLCRFDGRRDDALDLLRRVVAETICTDAHPLSTLFMAASELGMGHLGCMAYKQACEKQPKSEELLLGYVRALLTVRDFVGLQQCSMKTGHTRRDDGGQDLA